MHDVTLFRLYLLRAVYAFMAMGLFATIWPGILFPARLTASEDSVINALLGALALLFLAGIRYPLKLLPVLFFELLWKLIWVLGTALPLYLRDGLDQYATETLFACLLGIVLVPIAMPWRYFWQQYATASSERWRA